MTQSVGNIDHSHSDKIFITGVSLVTAASLAICLFGDRVAPFKNLPDMRKELFVNLTAIASSLVGLAIVNHLYQSQRTKESCNLTLSFPNSKPVEKTWKPQDIKATTKDFTDWEPIEGVEPTKCYTDRFKVPEITDWSTWQRPATGWTYTYNALGEPEAHEVDIGQIEFPVVNLIDGAVYEMIDLWDAAVETAGDGWSSPAKEEKKLIPAMAFQPCRPLLEEKGKRIASFSPIILDPRDTAVRNAIFYSMCDSIEQGHFDEPVFWQEICETYQRSTVRGSDYKHPTTRMGVRGQTVIVHEGIKSKARGFCPISGEWLFDNDAVFLKGDGFTYKREALEQHFRQNRGSRNSPATGQPLTSREYYPDFAFYTGYGEKPRPNAARLGSV